MDLLAYEKQLHSCYEQDLEIMYSNLKERMFQLQQDYFSHSTEDEERKKLRQKMNKINHQMHYLKKVIDVNVYYKGDLHHAITSQL